MEVALLLILLAIYLIIRFLVTDQETTAEKDRKRFDKGVELLRQKSYHEAYTYFDQQIGKNPKSAVAYGYRGKASLFMENYYSALYDLTTAISFDNSETDFYIDKGKVYIALKDFSLAFKELDKAVWHSKQTNADALRLRGYARILLNQREQARRDFMLAIELGDEEAAFLLRQLPLSTDNC